MKYLVLIVLLLFVFVACGAETTMPVSNTTVEPTVGIEELAALEGTLMEVRWQTEMCVDKADSRECETIMLIDASGTYTLTGNIPEPMVQTMTPQQLITIKTGILSTDLAALKETPFTDVCPRSYDGLAPIYIFMTPNGDIDTIIDSCTSLVNAEDPLFATIDMLYQEAQTP